MKKILCSLAVACISLVSAQISVNESFTTTPTTANGYTFVGFSGSAVAPIPCATGNRAMSKSFFNGSSTNVTNAITYSSDASNGGELNITFKYKHPPGSLNASVNGTMKVEYAVDNGEFQLLDSVVLNKVEQFCQTYTKSIDQDIIPAGKNFKLKISGTYISGDYYLVVDDLVITQKTPTLAVNSATKNQIAVYPNPVQNVVNLTDNKNVTRLVITDLSGRTVRTFDNPSQSTDVSSLKSGNYIINVFTVNGIKQSFKIIKK